jgi:periplasmic divalent cation tolerance protein
MSLGPVLDLATAVPPYKSTPDRLASGGGFISARSDVMTQAHIVLMTTVPSAADADKLAHILVAAKTAACVQIMPIKSCYFWDGKVVNDAEYLLLIKTRADLYGPAADLIKQSHSYEVPEIISVPVVAGSSSYLDWIDAVTSRND